jgi:hypothetical protein
MKHQQCLGDSKFQKALQQMWYERTTTRESNMISMATNTLDDTRIDAMCSCV